MQLSIIHLPRVVNVPVVQEDEVVMEVGVVDLIVVMTVVGLPLHLLEFQVVDMEMDLTLTALLGMTAIILLYLLDVMTRILHVTGQRMNRGEAVQNMKIVLQEGNLEDGTIMAGAIGDTLFLFSTGAIPVDLYHYSLFCNVLHRYSIVLP